MVKTDTLEAPGGVAGGRGTETVPVLMVGLGRGGSGKSTLEAEMIWRAQAQGRRVLVGDFDPRSRTLSDLFPDAIRPESEELPDVKKAFLSMLNRVAKERVSAVVDFGAEDRFLASNGRDLRLIEFCRRRGINPLALYVLGPEEEDLRHCLSIWRAGYFSPECVMVAMNEGVIREGNTVAGAFDATMSDPRFKEMVKQSGAKAFLVTRLACMAEVKKRGLGFYEAAAGRGAEPLDPVEEFMVDDWLSDQEEKRRKLGIAGWLP